MTYSLEVAFRSICGHRANNEDMLGVPSCFVEDLADERILPIPVSTQQTAAKGWLFLIADGVGGSVGGEIASEFVVANVAQRYYDDPSADLPTSLQRVIEGTNRALIHAQTQLDYPQMASTLTAVVVHHQQLIVANVGDSRAYLGNGRGEWQQLTGDHSRLQQWTAQGGSSPLSSAERHRITRSLGRQTQLGVDMWHYPVSAGQTVLLSTDGLNPALERLIKNPKTLLTNIPLNRQLQRLIELATDAGSKDNITGLMISFC